MDNETAEGNFESFDDAGDWTESAEESADNDDWSKGDDEPEAKEPKKEKVKEDLKVLKDSEADSEGKVIKEDGKKEPKKEDKEESFDDEEEETKEETKSEEDKESEEEATEDKPKPTKLRMRMGDSLYNVDSDATLPVKIDGKMSDIPVQELVNNYSGKVAWDKKFTEIGKEKKALEFEKNQVSTQKNTLVEHVNKAIAPLKDPNKNPLDSLMYLVEMSGEDPYTAYRRIMEANLEELSNLMDMSETERELHFHKKKDELYGKVAKQRQAKMSEEQNFNQLAQKVEKLRQAHNVSEDEFVDASEELEDAFKASGLDVDSITEEQVVDFASLKPHIAKVKELVEPYAENISEEKYGDVVAQLARFLRDGKGDDKSVIEILKKNFSVEEEVKELNTKLYQKQGSKKPSKVVENEGSDNESFSDWD